MPLLIVLELFFPESGADTERQTDGQTERSDAIRDAAVYWGAAL